MFSIVIPVLNEESSINKMIVKIKNKFEELKYEYEIIFVNDGSTDNTKNEIIKNKFNKIKLINNLNNKGYGYSIKLGILKSKYNDIIIIDGDMSYPLDALNEMIPKYLNGYDLLTTSRKNIKLFDGIGKSILRNMLGHILTFISGTKIKDPNSGLRIFKKSVVVDFLKFFSDGLVLQLQCYFVIFLKKKQLLIILLN